MIHRFQLFFKQRFNCCYILERNRAFFEIPFRYLCVNNLIYQCADAFFRVLRQAASSRFYRVGHHQDGLFLGERVRTGVAELFLIHFFVRMFVFI